MKISKKWHKFARFARASWRTLTAPLAIIYITYSHPIDMGYGMTYRKRIFLGFRFWRNHSRMVRSGMKSGTSWRAHLVIAMKLLELPPETKGDIIECGCWQGGSTINLSIISAITGRKLRVYDSFEGLPDVVKGDPVSERTHKNGFVAGLFGGSLELVQENVRRYGDINACSFHKGWFEDTLPHHEGDIAAMFLDVDFYSSLNDCLINLWPSLVDGGFLFMDEYNNIPYCAVFFSEKYWDKHFSCAPPGLIGTGTGVQVGMFYNTPVVKLGTHKIMNPESVSYCVKGSRALWEFYPDEDKTGNTTETDLVIDQTSNASS